MVVKRVKQIQKLKEYIINRPSIKKHLNIFFFEGWRGIKPKQALYKTSNSSWAMVVHTCNHLQSRARRIINSRPAPSQPGEYIATSRTD
jgi:hypothetical protein